MIHHGGKKQGGNDLPSLSHSTMMNHGAISIEGGIQDSNLYSPEPQTGALPFELMPPSQRIM
jgi:hypothetical protein